MAHYANRILTEQKIFMAISTVILLGVTSCGCRGGWDNVHVTSIFRVETKLTELRHAVISQRLTTWNFSFFRGWKRWLRSAECERPLHRQQWTGRSKLQIHSVQRLFQCGVEYSRYKTFNCEMSPNVWQTRWKDRTMTHLIRMLCYLTTETRDRHCVAFPVVV
jgi:hypothetical protein